MIGQISNQGSTKNLIITVLSNEFPLTPKRIHNRLIKRYNSNTTYHATYEHIRRMIDSGVLLKKNSEYYIDPKWIENMKIFINRMENKYNPFKNEAYRHVDISITKDAKILGFNSIEKFYDFMNSNRKSLIDADYKQDSNKGVFWLADHIFGPLLFMKDRLSSVKKMNEKKIPHYIAIRGDKPIDMFILDFYRKLGLNTVKIGVNDDIKHTMAVYDDVLIILLPNQTFLEFNKFLDSIESMENLDLNLLFEKFIQKKDSIQVLIIENSELVEYYKNVIIEIIKSKDD